MRSLKYSLFAVAALCLAMTACNRKKSVSRIEWPVMGTVAAVQMRVSAAGGEVPRELRDAVANAFTEVERSLSAKNVDSELRRLSSFPDDEVLEKCDRRMRPCYEAAFKLARASGGAFNPRWRGRDSLDLGAIAKGFAVDLACDAASGYEVDFLVDLGGNIKVPCPAGAARPAWKSGVKNHSGNGYAALIELREGEALATSATYYRGKHIRDGRTGCAVTNAIASVTVLCASAMWADALSTTLFVLGPDEGADFLARHGRGLVGECAVDVLWVMEDGRKITYPGTSRFGG